MSMEYDDRLGSKRGVPNSTAVQSGLMPFANVRSMGEAVASKLSFILEYVTPAMRALESPLCTVAEHEGQHLRAEELKARVVAHGMGSPESGELKGDYCEQRSFLRDWLNSELQVLDSSVTEALRSFEMVGIDCSRMQQNFEGISAVHTKSIDAWNAEFEQGLERLGNSDTVAGHVAIRLHNDHHELLGAIRMSRSDLLQTFASDLGKQLPAIVVGSLVDFSKSTALSDFGIGLRNDALVKSLVERLDRGQTEIPIGVNNTPWSALRVSLVNSFSYSSALARHTRHSPATICGWLADVASNAFVAAMQSEPIERLLYRDDPVSQRIALGTIQGLLNLDSTDQHSQPVGRNNVDLTQYASELIKVRQAAAGIFHRYLNERFSTLSAETRNEVQHLKDSLENALLTEAA